MQTIEFGDKVRHRTDDSFNAFLMTVVDVQDDKYLCEYIDYQTGKSEKEFFDETEIELVNKTDGGFIL